jgi:Gluconate 2-dehydrogenase subunit 3
MAGESKAGAGASDLTRREAIKLGAAAAVAVSIGGETPAAQARVPTFFTPDELALVDELSEIIIPTDEHSPGARTAKVAAYIDARLAEAWEDQERTTFREGLQAVDRLAQETNGVPFLRATADQRVAVLTRFAEHEKDPQSAGDRFFVDLKRRVVEAYYSSEIGIKQEMEYKGNVYLAEFVGTDVSR